MKLVKFGSVFRRMCVAIYMLEYIKRTRSQLLLIYKKPNKPVSADIVITDQLD